MRFLQLLLQLADLPAQQLALLLAVYVLPPLHFQLAPERRLVCSSQGSRFLLLLLQLLLEALNEHLMVTHHPWGFILAARLALLLLIARFSGWQLQQWRRAWAVTGRGWRMTWHSQEGESTQRQQRLRESQASREPGQHTSQALEVTLGVPGAGQANTRVLLPGSMHRGRMSRAHTHSTVPNQVMCCHPCCTCCTRALKCKQADPTWL